MAKQRVNVTISEELKNWLDEQAEAYGMNYSSVIAMALAQYKHSLEAIKSLGNIQELKKLIEDVQAKEDKK